MTTDGPANTVRIFKALGLAVVIAAPLEGLRQMAYYDPGGVLTACYGDTNDVKKGQRFTMSDCHGRLSIRMLEAIDVVERCVPGLPEHQLAAWADAVYNLGPVIVCDPKRSTAARLHEQHEHLLACNELPKWDKARVGGVLVSLPGLTKRRELEKQLCLSGTM